MTHLAHLLILNLYGHFDEETDSQLRFLAQKSVGACDSTLSIQVIHIIAQIKLLNSQLKRVKLK